MSVGVFVCMYVCMCSYDLPSTSAIIDNTMLLHNSTVCCMVARKRQRECEKEKKEGECVCGGV